MSWGRIVLLQVQMTSDACSKEIQFKLVLQSHPKNLTQQALHQGNKLEYM